MRVSKIAERYEQQTGHPAPVNGGNGDRQDCQADQAARLQIAQELGHNRLDVVAAYIGGRR